MQLGSFAAKIAFLAAALTVESNARYQQQTLREPEDDLKYGFDNSDVSPSFQERVQASPAVDSGREQPSGQPLGQPPIGNEALPLEEGIDRLANDPITGSEEEEAATAGGSGRWWLIGGCLVLVAAAAGAVYWYCSGSKKGRNAVNGGDEESALIID